MPAVQPSPHRGGVAARAGPGQAQGAVGGAEACPLRVCEQLSLTTNCGLAWQRGGFASA